MYSLDTNVFLDWQARYYPMDVFPGMRMRLDEAIAAGRCMAIDLVREELAAVGTPDIQAWMKSHRVLFVAPTSEIQDEGRRIESRYPALMDPRRRYESADAYVIALAKLRGGTVVTQETSAQEKRNASQSHYIPDVCRDLGVPCINLLGLMRREAWRF
jgi:predicted nucleic acid-binding protein